LTRINITPIILRKKIEERHDVRAVASIGRSGTVSGKWQNAVSSTTPTDNWGVGNGAGLFSEGTIRPISRLRPGVVVRHERLIPATYLFSPEARSKG
jgi:hypothetical protein